MKIGFICLDPLHYHVLKNIKKHFKDSTYILMHKAKQHKNDNVDYILNYTKNFLEKIGERFEIYKEQSKFNYFDKFDILVSLYIPPNNDFEKAHVMQVRAMYSLNHEDVIYGKWNNFYHLILCYGLYSKSKLRKYNRILEVVGAPECDDFFNNTLDFSSIENILKRIKKDKKNILYAPDWGSTSSIDKFGKEIGKLSNYYNIIVKLHHGTFFLEKSRYNLLKAYNKLIIVPDEIDTLLLINISDLIISDYSGIIFKTMLLNKPLLLLNLHDLNIFDDKFYKVVKNPSSIENCIRGIIPNITDKKLLPQFIKSILEKEINYPYKILKKYIDNFYAYQDGKAGLRSFHSIIKSYAYLSEVKTQ